jgi:hypothetical protein
MSFKKVNYKKEKREIIILNDIKQNLESIKYLSFIIFSASFSADFCM